MSIGSTIKRLRREKNITQEQLADYLGITSRAVSQWECDRTAPDISQIPILCNVLHVSADVLLGIDVEQKTKRIEELLKEAQARCELGYYEEGETILRDAHREFPDNYEIMQALMGCIWRTRNTDERAKEKDDLTREVLALGEKILEGCTDDDVRAHAIQLLCYTYPEVGETDKAVALAEKMPNRSLTREHLLSHIYRGTKRFDMFRTELHLTLNEIYHLLLYNNAPLDDKKRPYTNEEMIEIHKKHLAIMDIIFEDGNFGFYHQQMGWTNISLAEYYMRTGKNEEAVACLKTAKKHSIEADTVCQPTDTYTCLLFRGMEIGGMTHNISQNDCLHQLMVMEDGVFDPIRDTPDFKEIEEELKKYARHH